MGELSMSPRDLLMLSQRLRLMPLSSMELMDMVDTVLAMLDTDMELTHMPLDMPMVVTHMPMVPTMERDLLMLSLRLMPLSSTELTDMVDTVLDTPDTDMELTHMLLDTLMELTDMVDMVLDTDLTDMDTHMLMVDMDTHTPMASKLKQRLLSYCRQKLNSNLSFSIQ